MRATLKLFFLVLISVSWCYLHVSCSHKIASASIIKKDSAVFKFNTIQKNWGFIREGFTPSFTFEFENIGNAPLKIENIETECNCTIAEFSEQIISPHNKGFIKISYKSMGNLGSFNKSITIFSNATEKQKQLHISGIVISSGNK